MKGEPSPASLAARAERDAQRVENVLDLLAHGVDPWWVWTRCGWPTRDAAHQWLRRRGYQDVASKLTPVPTYPERTRK